MAQRTRGYVPAGGATRAGALSARDGAAGGSTGVFQDDTRFTFGAGIGVYVGLTEGLGLAFESRYQLATGEAPRPSIFPLTVRLTF